MEKEKEKESLVLQWRVKRKKEDNILGDSQMQINILEDKFIYFKI